MHIPLGMHEKISNIISVVFILALIAGHFFFGYPIYYLLCLYFALAIHEVGHYLAARYFKYESVRFMLMLPLGAAVISHKPVESLKEKLIILLAGPVPGIIIGYILLLSYSATQYTWAKQMGLAFLMVNGFNLLPIIPLDGGRIIRIICLKNIVLQRIIATISLFGLVVFLVKTREYLLVLLVIPQLLDFLMVWVSRVVIIRRRIIYKVKWKAVRNVPVKLSFYERGMILHEIEAEKELDFQAALKALYIWLVFVMLSLFPIIKSLQ